MIMDNQKDKRIDEILGSLDRPQRATAPDFFYTRLKARMQKESGVEPVRPKSWVLRPVIVMATLLLVLLLNAFVFIQSGNDVSNVEDDSIQAIAAEYNLTDGISEEVYK
jgi:hypothetical protein